MKKIFITIISVWLIQPLFAQTSKTLKEEDYYRIMTLPAPEGMLLEVGGVATLPDGRIAVCTRRGDLW